MAEINVNVSSVNDVSNVSTQQVNNVSNITAQGINTTKNVSAYSDKSHLYEQQALEHANTAKSYAEASEQSAINSENSSQIAQDTLNSILTNENLIAVAENEENINTVATDIENVNFVGNNIENIVGLVESLENLGDTTNIEIVATNINSVNTTANDIESVNNVSNNIEEIKTTNQNLININYVAENIEDIKTVEDNKNIVLEQTAIATEQAGISTEQATLSTTQANNSRIWAEGTDEEIQALGGEHSSKVWAEISEQQATISTEQVTISTTQASISTEQANNSLTYSQNAKASETNAKISETNAKTSEENAKTSEENALTSSNIATEQANIATEQANIATEQANIAKEEVAKISNVYKFKGSIATFDDLPLNAEIGDVYDVIDTSMNYAWTGEKWDSLGGVFDISWGNLTGTLSNQTDLQTALDNKQDAGDYALASDIPTDYVKNTDYATSSKHGIIKVDLATGISTDSTGKAYISKATDSLVTAKTNNYRPLVPSNIDLTVKTGITTNTIELTDEEKASAKEWLGISESGGGGGIPIGTIYSLNCTENYVPEGSLLCNGAEYSKEQFNDFWENYLKSETETGIVVNEDVLNINNNIMKNGVISNFNSPVSFNFDTNTLSASIGIKTSEDVTTMQFVCSNGSTVIWLQDGTFFSNNGGITTALPNTEYSFDLNIENSFISIEDEQVSDIDLITNNIEFGVGSYDGLDYFGKFLGEIVLTTGIYGYITTEATDNTFYTKAYASKLNTCTYEQYQQELATYGFCNKFAVDTTNETFKVPTAKQIERYLIAKKEPTETDSTWYNLYSDGWCEQGGRSSATSKLVVVNLLKPFIDTNYSVITTGLYDEGNTANAWDYVRDVTTSTFSIYQQEDGCVWEAKGYTDITEYSISRQFVVVANGSINQSQMDWSEWASGLNSKANIDLSNSSVPHIIEVSDKSILPSWYRIYSDGWCEQGGISDAGTITFLISFSDTNYTLVKTGQCNGKSGDYYGGANYNAGYYSKSVDNFVCYSNSQVKDYNWEASGYIS